MVFGKDDRIYDESLEKIRRFLGSQAHVHKDLISKVLEQTENRKDVEVDVKNPDGKGIHEETWKFTFNPPTGFDMEATSGPMTGTKFTTKYAPTGSKTKVEVSGEFHIQDVDEAATKKAALGFMEQVYNEDIPALKLFK